MYLKIKLKISVYMKKIIVINFSIYCYLVQKSPVQIYEVLNLTTDNPDINICNIY